MSKVETRAGVDIGGTFTDIVACQGDKVVVEKVLSTPAQPDEAVVGGVGPLLSSLNGQLGEFRHGTTVATNAILEGKGVKTAFVVTEGFASLLELRRQNRPHLYTLAQKPPTELIPADMCFSVKERVSAEGHVVTPLTQNEADEVAARVKHSGAIAASVCFLFSYLEPAHELMMEEALGKLGIHVSLSHQVMAARGEYERSCATVWNGLVSPIMTQYLEKMKKELTPKSFWVMSSRGTAMALEEVKDRGVETALSGPAAGVSGAVAVALSAHLTNIITFDMGGTSTDVALVEEGHPALTREGTIGGRPLGVEAVDIHTIGAGGGSLAYVDGASVLRVGPESAGASPGPACYGLGGTKPTVTDANVVLGRLRSEWFLDGKMSLHVDRAKKAIESLANELSLSSEEAALGILRVAESNMERALRRISLERGHDPRRFALVAFGGAGPLHGCAMARGLAIPKVLVPPDPGALCALGALTADEVKVFRHALSLSGGRGGREIPGEIINTSLADFPKLGQGWQEELFIELRYRGQSSALELLWRGRDECAKYFRQEHRRLYGFDHGSAETEVTAIIKRCHRMAEPCPPFIEFEEKEAEPIFRKKVIYENGEFLTPFFLRSQMGKEQKVRGPAVIGEHTSTVLVEPGFTARHLQSGSLLLETEVSQ